MAHQDHQTIFISAKNKINVDKLREMLYDKVKEIHIKRYPYNDFLYEIPEDTAEPN